MTSVGFVLTLGRFLLGDSETKGFIQFAFASPTGHIRCCTAIETLLRLLSRTVNAHYERFQKVLSNVSFARLKEYGFSTHLESAGMRKCRALCFEFLRLYESIHNVPESQAALKTLDSQVVRLAYRSWKQRDELLSQDPAMPHCLRNKKLEFESQSPVNTHSPHRLDEESLLDHTVEPCCLTFKSVLSQELVSEDIEYKQQTFKKTAYEVLSNTTARLGEKLCCYLDVVNRDMAVLRLKFPLDSKIGFGRFSTFDVFRLKRILCSTEASKRRTTPDLDDSSFLKNILNTKMNFMKKRSQASTHIRFISTNKMELKMHLKGQAYKMTLGLTELSKIPQMMSQGAISLKFGTPNSSKDKDIKNSQGSFLTIPVNQVHKNIGSTTSLHLSAEKAVVDTGVLSSTSTTAFSTSDSAPEIPETECHVHGELSVRVESVLNSSGITNAQICFDVFVATEDLSSKILLESLVSSQSLLENLLTDVFELMATA